MISKLSFGNAFFNPLSSCWIFFSSSDVNNLKVTVNLLCGKIKLNSFFPLSNKDSLIFLFSNLLKSIVIGSFLPYLSVTSIS